MNPASSCCEWFVSYPDFRVTDVLNLNFLQWAGMGVCVSRKDRYWETPIAIVALGPAQTADLPVAMPTSGSNLQHLVRT